MVKTIPLLGITWLFGVLLGLTLCLGLGGCGAGLVSGAIVKQGIILSLTYHQQDLSEALALPVPEFQVRSVRVTQEAAFLHDRLPTFHVQGTYDLKLSFPKQTVVQSKNPFDIYLQEQQEGKSWRLLIPALTDNDQEDFWESYLVPLS